MTNDNLGHCSSFHHHVTASGVVVPGLDNLGIVGVVSWRGRRVAWW